MTACEPKKKKKKEVKNRLLSLNWLIGFVINSILTTGFFSACPDTSESVGLEKDERQRPEMR